MSRKAQSILIVDDDESNRICISSILQPEGYKILNAASAQEAIEKSKTEVIDLFLIDIKLPDMEGTQLLAHFQETAPEAIKIIITGQPSIENATKALNMGANSFFTKPFEPEELLAAIKDKLQEREYKERITGKKLEEWVKLRISKTQSSEFNSFVEKIAIELGIFGLSKTQAKIYIGLNALGVASASEIASLSKTRREEVYRTIPELEKRGLITSKLGSPKRFVATEPAVALKILIKTKLAAVEREVKVLVEKKEELVAQLRNTSFGMDEENSIEALSQQDNVQIRLEQITKRTKKHIAISCSTDTLETILLPKIQDIFNTSSGQISARIIIDEDLTEKNNNQSNENELRKILFAHTVANQINVKQMEKIPFNVVLVDGTEAIWGDFQSDEPTHKVLWTNDQTQVDILKRAFDNLWYEAKELN